MRIEVLDEVTSTNDYIRRYIPAGENVVVCARKQTGGRGTKGRSFLSEEGGVYLSRLTFYEDEAAKNAFLVMARASLAVCETAERFGVSPEIKWPNDICVQGKKLAGILIENCIENDRLKYSVVGIGLNVLNDVSPLNSIAVTLAQAGAENPCVEEVRATLIKNLEKPYSFPSYRSRLGWLGKRVRILQDGAYEAVIAGVLPDGRLKIIRDGKTAVLSSAEIRLIGGTE